MTSVISTYGRNMINADCNDMLSFGAQSQTKLAFDEVSFWLHNLHDNKNFYKI